MGLFCAVGVSWWRAAPCGGLTLARALGVAIPLGESVMTPPRGVRGPAAAVSRRLQSRGSSTGGDGCVHRDGCSCR
jgi:hypothetical protein